MCCAVLLAALVLFSGCTGQGGGDAGTIQDSDTKTIRDNLSADMQNTAEALEESINMGLLELEAGIENNSKVLSEEGLTGNAAEAALSENLLDFPWAESSLVISKEGIVVTAVPDNYADIVGEDLSWQPQVQKANTEQVPVVSDVFTMAEGFTGISQSYPVFSPEGGYLGYTDITYRPDVFLEKRILPVTADTPYDTWVAQTDGTLLYDTKSEEIGNNLLEDEMYSDPALQAVLKKILAEESGTAGYVFSDKNWKMNVTKQAIWTTAGIDGTEWRVVVTYSGEDTEAGSSTSAEIVPATAASRYEELKRFVESAAVYAKENGKDAALAEFNDPDGSFIDGELYVFAYENDGTVIALPYQQEVLGTERAGITDANGVKFIDGLTEVAQDGGGSLCYIYQNPADDYKREFKLSYVLPVDDEWFVGSGIYLPKIPAEFNETEKEELVKRVKSARDYAQANGKEKAVSDFNDLNQGFADGANYIFAYDYEGNTLALPFQPEYVGTNRLGMTDTYGVKIMDREIAVAQNGGGFVYVEYLNPDTQEKGLKLCYVAPVDDEWFVGSGIYTEEL